MTSCNALRWQPEDSPEEKLTKLEQMLRQYRLPLEETMPFWAALLSVPLPEDRYPPSPFPHNGTKNPGKASWRFCWSKPPSIQPF